MDIGELLAFGVKNRASDLHLSAGLPPMIRVDGDVRRINVPALDHTTVHDLVYDIMNDKQRKDYEEFLECDFSFEIPGLARFRVNAFNQNRGAGAVFRTIPSEILSLEDLKAPKIFEELADQPRKRSGREREVTLFRRETVLPLDHGRGDQVTLPGQDQIVRRCGQPGQVPGEGLGCEILRPQDRSKRRGGREEGFEVS